MRSLSTFRKTTAIAFVLALSGCLVSEAPLLDASNGNATPVKPGAYVMCPVGEGDDGADCDEFTVTYDDTGLYRLDKEGEEPTDMRVRRVGRRGFAVQLLEDGDDAYLYYYGAGNSKRFRLTMMLCADLPEEMRAQLIEDGDLESDDEDFETCTVNTLKGVTASAKAYHRGDVQSDEEIALEFTPAPNVVD